MTINTLDLQLDELLLPPKSGDIEDGGQGRPISRETVDRTRVYIERMKQTLLKEKEINIGNPHTISRDFQGGVDVQWRKEGEYGILMNVSAEGTADYFWQREDKSDELQGILS